MVGSTGAAISAAGAAGATAAEPSSLDPPHAASKANVAAIEVILTVLMLNLIR